MSITGFSFDSPNDATWKKSIYVWGLKNYKNFSLRADKKFALKAKSNYLVTIREKSIWNGIRIFWVFMVKSAMSKKLLQFLFSNCNNIRKKIYKTCACHEMGFAKVANFNFYRNLKKREERRLTIDRKVELDNR